MTFLTTVLAETEAAAPAVPTFVFGLVALLLFGALGAVLWSYRDVSNRHRSKADAYAAAHSGGHGSGHGGGH